MVITAHRCSHSVAHSRRIHTELFGDLLGRLTHHRSLPLQCDPRNCISSNGCAGLGIEATIRASCLFRMHLVAGIKLVAHVSIVQASGHVINEIAALSPHEGLLLGQMTQLIVLTSQVRGSKSFSPLGVDPGGELGVVN